MSNTNDNNATNIVNRIMDYESGELGPRQVLELFSDLAKSGTLSHLQGAYHRQYMVFRGAGLLDENDDICDEALAEAEVD
jgi:hypothetical protein